MYYTMSSVSRALIAGVSVGGRAHEGASERAWFCGGNGVAPGDNMGCVCACVRVCVWMGGKGMHTRVRWVTGTRAGQP